MGIISVVAISYDAEGRQVIGKDNDMPWRKDPEMKEFRLKDMEHFKNLTMGYPVLMGRKTYESIPKRFRPFEGRLTVVVSSNPDLELEEGVLVVNSLESALLSIPNVCKDSGFDSSDIYIAGGGRVYTESMHLVNQILVTEFPKSYEGDTFFPKINSKIWKKQPFVDREGNKLDFVTHYFKRESLVW